MLLQQVTCIIRLLSTLSQLPKTEIAGRSCKRYKITVNALMTVFLNCISVPSDESMRVYHMSLAAVCRQDASAGEGVGLRERERERERESINFLSQEW